MKITDIKLRAIEDDAKLKAIVSITFDDSLAVHDIKIIEGQDKFFLAMPSKRMADGSYRDIVHPINVKMREEIEEAVIERYKASLE
ncbi:MAG: septation regulator SpoVG [Clostridiales bacterium]|nr:septation regulator SpoVG [Clostridiales bacterium]